MFNNHITDFNENIIGLRDFIDLIEPFLNEKIEEHNKHITPVLLLGVLQDVASKKTSWEEGEEEKHQQLLDKVKKNVVDIYNKEVEVEVEVEGDTNATEEKSTENSESTKKEFRIKIKAAEVPEFGEHLNSKKKVDNHIQLLYKNSFISLLSTTEWFFSQILHFNYNKFPNSAGIDKKTLTLSDLKSFGSVEDAEKYLIDTKIEEILRGNLDSWFAMLKSDLHLGLSYIDPIKEELIEIYQRRNLIVHNGGTVNSIYLSKVHEDFRKGIKLNDHLFIDKSYLDNATNLLQKSFILIAAELWKKLDKTDKTRGGILSDIVYENLLKSRWSICEGLTQFMINDANLEPTDKVIAQLNYWLCKKECEQIEEIKSELDKANFSDKKEIFQLALVALKDDVESFFKILPSAIDSKQLDIESLEEFPIFRTIRETPEYEKFKSDSGYFKDNQVDVSEAVDNE